MFSAGNWSPIISYLEDEDLVLVMDVNDMYGERGYLIPSKRLYDAINTRCIVSGNYRGLLLVRGLPKHDEKVNIHAPLLTKPCELSCAMGRLKGAYYRHIATSDIQSFTVDQIMNMDDDNAKGVSMITLDDDNKNKSAIVSLHPVSFYNIYQLPRKKNGLIDNAEIFSSHI